MAIQFSGDLEFPALEAHFAVISLQFSESGEVARITFESPPNEDNPYRGQELLGSLTHGGALLSLRFFPYEGDRHTSSRIEISKRKMRFLFDSQRRPHLYLVGTWYDFIDGREIRSTFIGVLAGKEEASTGISPEEEQYVLERRRLR